MSLTFNNFKKNLEKHFIYEKKPKIAIGVSGGPDSIALVILLNRWIISKYGKCVALIVDHKIRRESQEESLLTKKFLIKQGIKTRILTVKKNKVKEGKLSQARTNRFEKLLNYCQRNEIFHLFLGHHFDDNLETFIIRKIAGSNIEGLNSMQYTSLLKNIQIIRPLIFYTKKDIIFFNNKFNLQYINDPSNKDIKYSRVAIREFLNLNNYEKNKIINEFKLIKDNYNQYKKMIYQIFNSLIIKVGFKKIILDSNRFVQLNSELRNNILIKSIKYVNDSTFNIRSKKIEKLVKQILKFKKISLKTNKTLINSIEGKIIIIKH